jgi:hypothetical protein
VRADDRPLSSDDLDMPKTSSEDLDMPKTWIPRAGILLLAAAFALDVVNGVLYVVGGYGGAYLASNEAYTP